MRSETARQPGPRIFAMRSDGLVQRSASGLRLLVDEKVRRTCQGAQTSGQCRAAMHQSVGLHLESG